VPSDRLDGVALVTGGGRGIGASIARELAEAGMRVAVTGRTPEQVEAVAREIGGLALVGDVSRADDVEHWVGRTEEELGPIDLLAANAGIGNQEGATWEIPVDAWWHVLEVNVLGVHLSCRAVIPGMLERGRGRIVITGSGAAYLPGSRHTAYPTSKAAVCRYGETLANELAGPFRCSSSARASCGRT
jgi:NAD(P)-dependent dehydrogenase (short-subunit alcohol dehydrogenase family)